MARNIVTCDGEADVATIVSSLFLSAMIII